MTTPNGPRRLPVRNPCTGQVCFSVERIYVHESVHDEFVEILTARAARLELNYPDPDRGELGPFGCARQAEVAGRHLADAVARGAVVRAGGPARRGRRPG